MLYTPHCHHPANENNGSDLKRQIGVELPHDWGHFGDRGRIERLPAVVLDSEVEERIGGGETVFRDKGAVE